MDALPAIGRQTFARLKEAGRTACLDYGDRVATAGGAEFDIGGQGVRQGRPEIGDDPRQQRLERIRDEAKMPPDPQSPVVA